MSGKEYPMIEIVDVLGRQSSRDKIWFVGRLYLVPLNHSKFRELRSGPHRPGTIKKGSEIITPPGQENRFLLL
jgi:hypothetical protein